MVSIYNSGRWIDRRLKNIFQSTIAENLDVVCVNANSPDPLDHEIPQRYPCRYIKLDHNLSLYDTWNHIINTSNTPYITNANTDDLVSPTAYEKLLNTLSESENICCIYPSWHTTSNEDIGWSDINPSNTDLNGGQPGQFKGDIGKASPGHFPMWKRNLHDSVGMFDPSFTALADAHFWTRAYYLTKYDFLWHREALGCYLWRDGQNLWNRMISSEQWSKFHHQTAELRSKAVR